MSSDAAETDYLEPTRDGDVAIENNQPHNPHSNFSEDRTQNGVGDDVLERGLIALQELYERGKINETTRVTNEQRCRQLAAALSVSRQNSARAAGLIARNAARTSAPTADAVHMTASVRSVSQLESLDAGALRQLLQQCERQANSTTVNTNQMEYRIQDLIEQRDRLREAIQREAAQHADKFKQTPAMLERQIVGLKREVRIRRVEYKHLKQQIASHERNVQTNQKAVTDAEEQLVSLSHERDTLRQLTSTTMRAADGEEKKLATLVREERQQIQKVAELSRDLCHVNDMYEQLNTDLNEENMTGERSAQQKHRLMEECRRVTQETENCLHRKGRLLEEKERTENLLIKYGKDLQREKTAKRDLHKMIERLECECRSTEQESSRRQEAEKTTAALSDKLSRHVQELEQQLSRSTRAELQTEVEAAHEFLTQGAALSAQQLQRLHAAATGRSQQLRSREQASEQLKSTRLEVRAQQRLLDAGQQVQQQMRKRQQLADDEIRVRSDLIVKYIDQCQQRERASSGQVERNERAMYERDDVATRYRSAHTTAEELQFKTDILHTQHGTLETSKQQLDKQLMLQRKVWAEEAGHCQRLVERADDARDQLHRYWSSVDELSRRLAAQQAALDSLHRTAHLQTQRCQRYHGQRDQLAITLGERLAETTDFQGRLLVQCAVLERRRQQLAARQRDIRDLNIAVRSEQRQMSCLQKRQPNRRQLMADLEAARQQLQSLKQQQRRSVDNPQQRSCRYLQAGASDEPSLHLLNTLQRQLLAAELRVTERETVSAQLTRITARLQQRLAENGGRARETAHDMTVQRSGRARVDRQLQSCTTQLAATRQQIAQQQQINQQLREQLTQTSHLDKVTTVL